MLSQHLHCRLGRQLAATVLPTRDAHRNPFIGSQVTSGPRLQADACSRLRTFAYFREPTNRFDTLTCRANEVVQAWLQAKLGFNFHKAVMEVTPCATSDYRR